MKAKIVSSIILLLIVMHAKGIEPEAIIISQDDSPIEITSYSIIYAERTGSYRKGIDHNLEYKNICEKTIVAIRIDLVCFDVWNEFIEFFRGISIRDIDPGATKEGTWTTREYSDFSFLTGLAYVSKVRFSDGTVWTADLEPIREELWKLEEDFDIQKLTEKPSEY